MNFKEQLVNISKLNTSKLAVVDHQNKIKITYGELIEYTNGFLDLKIKKRKIGIFIDKSADYLIAVFALTISDCSFVPLDPNLPDERLNFIINDSDITDFITNEKFKNRDILKNKNVHFLSRKIDNLKLNYQDDSLIYTVYTSGTTGVPKGVEVTFSGISNVINQQISIFELNHSQIYWFLSMSFDASLSDIYCSLLSGSTIHIDESIKYDTNKFIKFVDENKISYIDIPPSFIKLINPNDLPSLKSIVIGGEVADPETVQSYAKKMKVINVYGPTEATICTSYSICHENWNKPLIGIELDNVLYSIFDEDLNIVSNGTSGELYISGIQLAKGYTNKKITDERFIYIDGQRWYKSGDKVIQTEFGLEFIGRIDRQIKHNGQLICLEEIEQAINAISAVKNVSVIYSNKKIHAYYEGNISKEEIITFISNIIPNYMIPHFYINESIPKTSNGKNDSKFLTNNNIYSKIFNIFYKILETDINEDLSFKENGADSVNFIQLKQELDKIGLNIPQSYLIEYNKIEDIINYNKIDNLTKNDLINKFDFKSLNIKNNIVKNQNKIALITGCNGNLGSYVLEYIKDKYDLIYCLVRGNKESAIKKYECNNKFFDNIIIIPISDLSDNYLGMNKDIYNSLKYDVSDIYHIAANVNNILSFESLYNSNVLSTKNIINFSFDENLKNIYYASTLSVHVSGSHNKGIIIDESPLKVDDEILFNGYAQTKWLSDYIMTYSNIHNNIKQFRFGLLVPKDITEQDSNSFLYQVLEGIYLSENLPNDDIGICFDFTPIDWAAKVMVDNSLKNDNIHIYNISTNKKIYYNQLIDLFNKKTICKTDWFNKNDNYLSVLLNILNKFDQPNMNLFEMTYISHFQTNNIENAIKIDYISILNGYLKYFKDKY